MNKINFLKIFSFEKPIIQVSILFIILIGLFSGVFLERCLPSDDKAIVFNSLESLFFSKGSMQRYNFFQIYYSYIKYSFVSLLFIYASSILIVLAPLIILFALWAGFSLGFTSTVLIDFYGLKGQGIVFATVMPFCFINLFITSTASSWSFAYIKEFLKSLNCKDLFNKKRASTLSSIDTLAILDNIKEFSGKILIVFILSLFLYLIQAFLCTIFG